MKDHLYEMNFSRENRELQAGTTLILNVAHSTNELIQVHRFHSSPLHSFNELHWFICYELFVWWDKQTATYHKKILAIFSTMQLITPLPWHQSGYHTDQPEDAQSLSFC